MSKCLRQMDCNSLGSWKRQLLKAISIALCWASALEMHAQNANRSIDTLVVKSASTTKILVPGAAAVDLTFPSTNGVLALEHELSAHPVATIVSVLASQPLPDQFLRPSGQAVSRTEYSKLFRRIGTVYGTGDGSSTFNLPTVIDPYVPRDALIGWWPMLNAAKDQWYHNNDGAVSGASIASDRNDHPEAALSFDGIDDAVEVANEFFNLGWAEWSISIWMRPDSLKLGTILNTIPEKGVKIRTTADGEIELAIGDGTNWLSDTWMADAVYQENEWMHLCVVRSNLNIKVYVNGVLDSEFTLPNAPPLLDCSLYLGRCDCDNEFMVGRLDDLGIWRRVLTQDEIAGLFASSLYYAIRSK